MNIITIIVYFRIFANPAIYDKSIWQKNERRWMMTNLQPQIEYKNKSNIQLKSSDSHIVSKIAVSVTYITLRNRLISIEYNWQIEISIICSFAAQQ